MSPKKRRPLALPFLITVAASSCAVQSGSTTNSRTPHRSSPANGVHRTERPPLQPGELAPLETEQPGTDGQPVRVNPTAGSHQNTATTPEPPVSVNPPPPPRPNTGSGMEKPLSEAEQHQQKLPDAPATGRTFNRPDGSCWWTPTVDCSDKTRTCNPPPPKRVNCK